MSLYRQALRFATVGVVNTAVGLSVIFLLMLAGVDPVWANACGFGLGFAVSFMLNRVWTFRVRAAAHQLPAYMLVGAVSYGANLVAVVAAIAYFPAHSYPAQLVGVGTYSICMFLGCRWFAFGPNRKFASTQ